MRVFVSRSSKKRHGNAKHTRVGRHFIKRVRETVHLALGQSCFLHIVAPFEWNDDDGDDDNNDDLNTRRFDPNRLYAHEEFVYHQIFNSTKLIEPMNYYYYRGVLLEYQLRMIVISKEWRNAERRQTGKTFCPFNLQCDWTVSLVMMIQDANNFESKLGDAFHNYDQ